jgi:hypothetical protein
VSLLVQDLESVPVLVSQQVQDLDSVQVSQQVRVSQQVQVRVPD